MNDILPYDFEDNLVRVVLIGGDPWWIASDVAKVLGYRDAANMVRNLEDDEKGTHIVSTLGGEQQVSVISESGLYVSIFKSRREEAIKFRKWVTGTVLPELRRTGRYTLHDEPPPNLPHEAQAVELQARVSVVRTALRLFGTRGARDIWVQMGLPVPIAHARASAEDDPLATSVREWIADRSEVSVEDVCAGLDIVNEVSIGRRIGALLRMFGWRQTHVARDGHRTFRMFSAPGTARWDEMGGDHV
jgi:prophage antirepressor-like protein